LAIQTTKEFRGLACSRELSHVQQQ